MTNVRDNLLQWISYLENGSYQQGQGCLRFKDYNNISHYCCLGVALDLIDPDGWHISENAYKYNHVLAKVCDLTGFPGISFMNNDAAASYGLTSYDQHQLSNFNDCGNSFKFIANYIRENILVRYPETVHENC